MSPRARRLKRQRSHGLSTPQKILIGVGVIVALIGGGVAGVGAWVLDVRADAPDIDTLKPIDEGETSFVYAADGSRLGAIQADTLREPVSLDEIPEELQQATVAIEDENFYEHDGVDYEAIARAAIKNIEAGEIKQGGSTITQQLARNLYIQKPEDTIERKITEAALAEQMEEEHSKDWILEKYLNTASYGTNNGRTAIGVEAASQVYFDKSVSELNLNEAALLAGLPQAPSLYNPFSSTRQAEDRRNAVLQHMYEQRYITLDEEQKALKAPGLGLERGYRYEAIAGDRYFFDYVEADLIDRYGVNTVRQGGLEVYTTINPALQALAKEAVVNGATSLTGLYGTPSQALTSIDVTNGHIVAMASSSSYETSKYNLAAQGHRQPGSAFKPFVLATAIDQGIDPDSTYYSGASPTTLSMGQYAEPWVVNNAGDTSGGGTMSLRDATVGSVNVVYAQLGLDVGPENFDQMARDLGADIDPPDPHPSEAIGGLTNGVSPLGMASAYSTFANGGVHHEATAIDRVEFPDGQVDDPDDDEGNRVLTEGEAYTVTDILEGVITGGTGTAANYCGTGDAEAGKTGTTDENTDAWFVGYTKRLSTAVWTGYPNENLSLGSSAFGGTHSAPTWNEFMSQADPNCEPFDVPTELPDLSSFYGGHTTSYEPEPEYDTDYDYDSTTTTEDDGDGAGAYNEDDLQQGADPADNVDGPDANNGGGNG
jgi:penicillin-binding protein 1A